MWIKNKTGFAIKVGLLFDLDDVLGEKVEVAGEQVVRPGKKSEYIHVSGEPGHATLVFTCVDKPKNQCHLVSRGHPTTFRPFPEAEVRVHIRHHLDPPP